MAPTAIGSATPLALRRWLAVMTRSRDGCTSGISGATCLPFQEGQSEWSGRLCSPMPMCTCRSITWRCCGA